MSAQLMRLQAVITELNPDFLAVVYFSLLGLTLSLALLRQLVMALPVAG